MILINFVFYFMAIFKLLAGERTPGVYAVAILNGLAVWWHFRSLEKEAKNNENQE